MNYYSHHIGDYRRDTTHLSLLEHGVYRQLIDQYYLDERAICMDDAKLMRSLCVRNADELQAVKNVLADFFVLTDAGYIHKRCDVEIEAFHAKSKGASESAKARWDRVRLEKEAKPCERIADALPTQCEGNANHKPITNNHKPVTNKDKSATPAALPDLFSGIDSQVVSDFKALRTKQKAAITKTAIDGIQREADKAGISLEYALTICCERGWRGFKAEWVSPRSSPAQGTVDFDAARKAANDEAKRRLFGNKNAEVIDG